MSTCQSCRAEVVFVPSAKTGRPMILDAKPTKGIVVGPDPLMPNVHAARVVDVYTDHHVTCPAAKEWQGHTRKSPPVRSVQPGLVDVDGGRRGD